ncbi:hypothetical protein C8J57DRAFT_1380985 [Mycena rebaudengoi]|nr:hypothetical protein C8J57DRAFT_1380985 [Mycena rebaudengoi]
MVSAFWYDISQLWTHGSQSPGIYFVLFCICMYILLHRPSSRGNTVLLVTAIALFTFSTILIVLILVLVTAEIEELANIPSIADGLLIYRCYVVWNHDWRIIVLPHRSVFSSCVSRVLTLGEACGLDVFLDATPQFAVILATNFLATGLTAGRIWWISHHSRAYLEEAAQRRYASAIVLIVESGMLYSATILAFLIVISFPSLSSTLEEPVLQIVTQVMGIAPTLIIVRVGLGVTVEGSLNTFRTTTTTSIPLRQQRHAGSRLGTSIGSIDPKENLSTGFVAGFRKPRYPGDAAV